MTSTPDRTLREAAEALDPPYGPMTPQDEANVRALVEHVLGDPAQLPLWEHPEPDTFGADEQEAFETWPELRDNVREYLGALNIPYRWEWREDEDHPGERLYISVLLARKERVVDWWCPITRDDEPEVRELLADIAAYLRTAGCPMVFDDGRGSSR